MTSPQLASRRSAQHPDRAAVALRATRYAHRARVSDLLVTLLWSSGALAIALFLTTGGTALWGTPAVAITSLGIITGLVGSDFILVMLVLAARVPLLDRTIGHDRAIALHRRIGKPALYLILAHAVLLLIGYGMSEGINPIAEIGSMLALPDMPLAFIGTGLLIIVVVTSLVAVRRKFSYEGWHLVHLLSYVAVAVAIPHQLSLGGVLAAGSMQRIYWVALYVMAFGAIGWFRFAHPLLDSLWHGIRVSRVTQIAPGVASIELRGRDLKALGGSGGQFLIWRFWTPRTWWHSHPLSLSAVPTSTTARITVRELGKGSAKLQSIPVGTRVWIEGPYGLFSNVARTSPRLAVIAAGIGVTPIRALLEDAPLAPGEATVLLRAGDDSETYHWDEIREIAAAKGARFYTMIGHRSRRGHTWASQDDAARGVTLASVFPGLLESDLYVCGPTAWLESVVAEARSLGVAEHRIHAERFDW
ncbi:MAG: ferredoxin reductase family protein [Pseudolysinimonas sp.]